MVRLCAVLALAFAPAVAACGDDSPEPAQGNGIDRAFASEMIAHHRSAVEMAKAAERRSDRRQITQLADAIIQTQTKEIPALERLDGRLEAGGVNRGELGMPMEEMGMAMGTGALDGARPFDRHFIDMMIAHHQGAIRMARVQLATGENAQLKRISRAVIDAQAKEIDTMNTWRVDWYGELSPSGGVPAEGGPAAPEEGVGGHHGG
jgi:uncharacterized protein (DUF305 family)